MVLFFLKIAIAKQLSSWTMFSDGGFVSCDVVELCVNFGSH